MLPGEKHAEYELMTYADKRTIKVEIPNGPQLVCHNSWDYKTNFTETVFKTTTEIRVTNPLLKVEPIDLNPVSNIKAWKVHILRRPESNLKDEDKRRR